MNQTLQEATSQRFRLEQLQYSRFRISPDVFEHSGIPREASLVFLLGGLRLLLMETCSEYALFEVKRSFWDIYRSFRGFEGVERQSCSDFFSNSR